MATSGIMAFMPSAEPLFVESVESVSHALKQASFAEELKNVMTQSMIITAETPTDIAETAEGKSFSITSVRMSAKLQMEIPQAM